MRCYCSVFVPGLRQFAGYFVGILRIPYLTFAVYAYIGAVLWVTFFFGIGFVFGKEWQIILGWVERHFAFVAAGGRGACGIHDFQMEQIRQGGEGNQVIRVWSEPDAAVPDGDSICQSAI